MKKISHKKPFRRTLAIICAATIAMLQCAVLLTVEPVHGAGNITVNAKVNGISEPTLDDATPSLTKDVTVGEETKKGCTVGSFLDSIGLSTVGKYYVGEIEVSSDDYIINNESSGYDFVSGGSVIASGNSINVDMDGNYWPVDYTVDTGSLSVAAGKPGKPITANIIWKDSFFSKDKDKYVAINWATTAGSDKVKLSRTSGESTEVAFKAVGAFTITATNIKNPNDRGKQVKGNAGKDMGNNSITITVPNGNYKKGDTPEPVVKDNGNKLHKGTHYELKYNYDSSKGIGYITVIGKGNYTNRKTVHFPIKKETTPKKPSTKSSSSNKKTINSSDVTIKVKRGEKIKASDSDSEIKDKLSVSVKNVPSPLKSSQWELLDYDKRHNEANIRITIDGYETLSINGKEVKTSRYYSNNNNNNNNSGRTFTFRRPSNASSSPSTGTTVPNVTYAPDRTITVKEVYLGEKIEDEPQTDPMDGTMTEPMDGTESTDYSDAMDVETPPLQFGPAAGSAAVAAAAAGAGAVGRIRRFKLDTATEAVEQVTNSEE